MVVTRRQCRQCSLFVPWLPHRPTAANKARCGTWCGTQNIPSSLCVFSWWCGSGVCIMCGVCMWCLSKRHRISWIRSRGLEWKGEELRKKRNYVLAGPHQTLEYRVSPHAHNPHTQHVPVTPPVSHTDSPRSSHHSSHCANTADPRHHQSTVTRGADTTPAHTHAHV